MKNIFLLLSTFLAMLISHNMYAVDLVIAPASSTNAQCPLTNLTYTASAASGSLPICTYTWSITGGTIISFSTSPSISVIVKWNDQIETGTLTITTGNCRVPNENGSTKTNTYTRLSVAGQNFLLPSDPLSVCTNSIAVPICSNDPITICADKMFIKNTGGAGEPVKREVDRYIWSIPAGWKEFGTSNIGPVDVSLSLNSITLEPVSANGGTVTVVGSIKNSCNADEIVNSNPKIITITRTPPIAITAPAGYVGPRCGLTNPVTFTVNSPSCATSYTWTKPSTWSGTSTSNSITLTPDGETGGTLTVTIALSTGYSTTKSFDLTFINTIPYPSISKSSNQSEICSGESWTFTNTPPSTYPTNYGFDWYATGGLLINGVSTSSSSPLHTTTNTVSVSANSGSYGTAYIYTRVNNNVCTPSSYVHIQTQVGTLSSSQFSISGPSTACPNTTVSYLSTYIDPSITNYQWSWSGFASASGQGTPYLSATTASSFTNGTITLRIGNRCGLTGSPAVKFVTKPYCSGGFSYALSPNPTDEALTVTVVDEISGVALTEDQLPMESDQTFVAIVNNRSRVVSSGNLTKGKISFDVSSLPTGLYVVKITAEGRVTSKQILIKH